MCMNCWRMHTEQKGDAKAEAAVLTAYENEGGQDPAVLKRLATLEEAAGQQAEAAATLERAELYLSGQR